MGGAAGGGGDLAGTQANATKECGWSWLSSGRDDNLGRPVTQILLRPALDSESDFAQNSTNVTRPGTEKAVMGAYLPAPIWGTENTIKPAYQKVRLAPGTPMDVPPGPAGIFAIPQLLGQLNDRQGPGMPDPAAAGLVTSALCERGGANRQAIEANRLPDRRG